MTRLAYTDLALSYTPGASTYPSITHLSGYITALYKEAAEIMGETYSATNPDTDFLFALIKSKVENYVGALQRASQPEASWNVPTLIFSEKEEIRIRGSEESDSLWTVDSASKTEDIGD
jgi:hypothetical protein